MTFIVVCILDAEYLLNKRGEDGRAPGQVAYSAMPPTLWPFEAIEVQPKAVWGQGLVIHPSAPPGSSSGRRIYT